ncbi:MAG: hypothetical protein HY774_27475 [Acidobacteria bacterium]|nr:hypothetical protein [Acidobacteriota bacterium]
MKIPSFLKLSERFLTLRFLVFVGLVCVISCASHADDQTKPQSEKLTWTTVIAGKDEPGERLRVSGRVLRPDGKTPVPGILVDVHHTDAQGLYNPKGTGQAPPRLRARLQTNAQGQYEFHTIKPAPYPDGGNPAHIHFAVYREGEPKRFSEIFFDGDPNLTEAFYKEMRDEKANFQVKRPVRNQQGVLECSHDIILSQ